MSQAVAQKEVHVLSLGAGVQSSTMALMAARGEIQPKPDYVIFSDTGWEPRKVYEWLDFLTGELKKHGIEVIVAQRSNIREDVELATRGEGRFASIPFFVRNSEGKQGMARRQCTGEYKINPIHKKVRSLLGYEPRKHIKKEKVHMWMGISTDEIVRMKPSRVKWIEHRYPLIEKDMSRFNCLEWMQEKGYPLPPKSAWIGCPYHDDRTWLDMKRNDPESWEDAVKVDKMIRNNIPRIDGEVYLHRSMKPLDEVDLKEDQIEFDLFDNECEGMCGL